MPATEQTWRDQKRVHVVFGVTSLIMLISTIWMFADDHAREWKDVQLQMRGINRWMTEAQIREQQTADFSRKLAESERALRQARSQPVAQADIEDFKTSVQNRAAELESAEPDFAALDAAYAALLAPSDEVLAFTEQFEQARAQAATALAAAQRAEQEGGENAAAARQVADEALAEARAAAVALDEAIEEMSAARTALLEEMDNFISEARLLEDNKSRTLKFQRATLTAEVSQQGLAISQGRDAGKFQARIDELGNTVRRLTREMDAAKTYRQDLEQIVGRITEAERTAETELNTLQSDLNRLHTTLQERSSNPLEWLVRQPVLDAFYTGDLKIDQIWLPDLTIDYNFSDVARYDRCTTCHRAIAQTEPGTADQPAYEPLQTFQVTLATPSEPPPSQVGLQGQPRSTTISDVYGIGLAEFGRLNRDDVTIEFVWPETLGAQAGLQMGDVIRQIGDAPIYTPEQAADYLLEDVDWGQTLTITIERGLPNPFISHPRLDLFVGSLSPHQMGDMGCTICHEGQGSATEFKYTSHTPNTPQEADQWHYEHGWFDNPHWIFPMYANRFVESGCLKCHHEVTDLLPSERFPEPPAPKVTEGYRLIVEYGCFGCHEVNGYDGPDQRVGPDLRTEPNYFAVAEAVLSDEALTDNERGWAQALVGNPDDNPTRYRLLEAIQADKELANAPDAQVNARLTPATHQLGDLLKDQETPGKLRSVGPSLRHVASKVDFDFLYSWIREPSDFRPTTKMPQFFGLRDHLDLEEGDVAPEYEPLEIRAIAEYLLANSRPFSPITPPEGETAAASAERGKKLFQVRGCLACHSHEDFPGIASTQGPDLTGLGAKLTGERGQQWLYSWLKDPSAYHTRTVMPDLFLDPIQAEDGTVTDPAADIAEYLLSSQGWQPENVPSREMTAEERTTLEDLAVEYLSTSFSDRRAREYLQGGIPTRRRDELKSAELVLLEDAPGDAVERQLRYVGLQAISKYGCFGCHDIPGFEAAKPIGTALTDWGRKNPSMLAFEQIHQYLSTPQEIDKLHGGTGDVHAEEDHGAGHGGGHGHGPSPEDFDPDTGYYLTAIKNHSRQGFIWQKLRAPRSYDYKKTENKGYNERLRMPKFPFTAEEREAVITFVLGLVAEPPSARYIYQPDPQREAIVQGHKVLEKYNCGGCHILEMDRWEFNYHPSEFSEALPQTDYPFLTPVVDSQMVADSLTTDDRGMRHAVLHGMPAVSEETYEPLALDIDGVPLFEDDGQTPVYRSFTLWETALINGEARAAGLENLLVRDEGVTKHPAVGGDLARYLFPVVIADEKQRNPQVKGGEAWGWLPPPLAGEGRKVQPGWLHEFLLDPYPIRPSAVLRMPKFNMSSDEAGALVDYFAAMDDAQYPYEFNERQRASYLAAQEADHPDRLADALNIVVNRNYCVQCHLVGDFSPGGSTTALAPNLDLVHRRLRPDFVRRWVANPKRMLPYTGMPVNIPYADAGPHYGGISQDIYSGTSIEQLDALVDLLMNYDRFAERRISIREQVPPPQTQTPATTAAGGGSQ
ncbi:MAG: PDZ domain-containing protein [Pirellulales bacterium]